MAESQTDVSNEAIGAMFLGEQPVETPPEPPVEGDEAEISEEVVEATDEEIVETEASEEVSEPELVEVEWEGQLIEAPKAVAEALMRQSDYTQKTQDLAAERKTYEVAAAQVQEIQKAYAFAEEAQSVKLELQQADQLISQWETHIAQNAKDMDAASIAQAQLEIKNIERFKAAKQAELGEKQTEFQQAQEQALKELLQKGTEVLRQRIPGWGKSHQDQMKEYAASLGYTEQEVNSVIDPRQVEVLWKAAQYDKLKEGKAAAVKTVQDAPTIKSKARNPMPKDVQEKLTLRNKLKSNKLTAAQKQAAVAADIGKRWG